MKTCEEGTMAAASITSKYGVKSIFKLSNQENLIEFTLSAI
jgi:hypothetical protein